MYNGLHIKYLLFLSGDGQTDMMLLCVASCNFMNTPKNDTSFMNTWVPVWLGMWGAPPPPPRQQNKRTPTLTRSPARLHFRYTFQRANLSYFVWFTPVRHNTNNSYKLTVQLPVTSELKLSRNHIQFLPVIPSWCIASDWTTSLHSGSVLTATSQLRPENTED